ncbi:MAG: methyltransferase domain-containing protein [Planctomycetes bacterium]|nr:methyltransferase domain-containing protein [Planctomycetota bacterium]
MKKAEGIGLKNVQDVYAGPEGELWELIMGRQIHIGGWQSSKALADRAGIKPGSTGVDLCCCTGEGMRFLVRYCGEAKMIGVDATLHVIKLGKARCRYEGMADKISFMRAEATATGLDAECCDFVWGQDAWCYVADKPALIAEAARLVRPGGTIAFSDWMEGAGLGDADAARYLKFMKFPNILSLDEYNELLKGRGFKIVHAADSGLFGRYADLYINMLNMQLTGDALRIIGHDAELLEAMGGEMDFMRRLAHSGRIIQGVIVARKG